MTNIIIYGSDNNLVIDSIYIHTQVTFKPHTSDYTHRADKIHCLEQKITRLVAEYFSHVHTEIKIEP